MAPPSAARIAAKVAEAIVTDEHGYDCNGYRTAKITEEWFYLEHKDGARSCIRIMFGLEPPDELWLSGGEWADPACLVHTAPALM